MAHEAITVADSDDPDLVASVLGEAFLGDTFMEWIFRDAEQRPRQVEEFWKLVIANRSDAARIMASGDGGSAALWYPPVFDAPSADAEAADNEDADDEDADEEDKPNPVVDFLIAELGDDAGMGLQGLGRMQEVHPTAPHWYLTAIGTRVAKQGQGQGSAMLAPVLAEADEQGLPCYLESSNPRNLPFYFRHGFVSTGEVTMPDGKTFMTTMWRDPR